MPTVSGDLETTSVNSNVGIATQKEYFKEIIKKNWLLLSMYGVCNKKITTYI